MKHDDKARLEHMLESAKDAISFLGSMTEDELAQNRMALQAIVRSVEIIGEAASQLTPEFRSKNTHVPWAQIVGMRNRLIHAYFDIDHELVFSTVQADIPILVDQIKQFISEFA
jgi:uncharacterized protein with HEPN domain